MLDLYPFLEDHYKVVNRLFLAAVSAPDKLNNYASLQKCTAKYHLYLINI